MEIILEISAVACQLDSSGSSLRNREFSTVPSTAMLSVRDSEVAIQKFYLDLNSAAALYYTQYYTGPSELCVVVVWPRGGHPTERDQRCGVIILVTRVSGSTAENTHSNKPHHNASVLLVR